MARSAKAITGATIITVYTTEHSGKMSAHAPLPDSNYLSSLGLTGFSAETPNFSPGVCQLKEMARSVIAITGATNF